MLRTGTDHPSNRAQPGMKARLRIRLARNPWLLPAAMWVLLYAWRPFLFGFYHDDWSLLLGCNGAILEELYCTEMSRPGAPLIRWAIHGLIGTNPAAWQFVTSISILGVALTLIALLGRMTRTDGDADAYGGWAPAVAATVYLAFPWMLGIAWINGILTNVATIFFTLAMLIWFARWSLKARCIVSALCFLLSGLIYEAYWFAFLPFSALLLLRGTLPRRDLMTLAATLAGVQVLLIGYNRIAAAISTGANKSFDPGWLHTLSGAWPPIVGGLRDIYGISGRYLFVALLVLILACLGTRLDVRRALATLVPISAGIAISFSLFAVAGYVVVLTGLFARTTIGFSWWLAVAAAFAAAHVEPAGAPAPDRVRRGICAVANACRRNFGAKSRLDTLMGGAARHPGKAAAGPVAGRSRPLVPGDRGATHFRRSWHLRRMVGHLRSPLDHRTESRATSCRNRHDFVADRIREQRNLQFSYHANPRRRVFMLHAPSPVRIRK